MSGADANAPRQTSWPQHDDGRRAELFVGRDQRAAELCGDPRDTEGRLADRRPPDRRTGHVLPPEVPLDDAEDSDVVDGAKLVAPQHELVQRPPLGTARGRIPHAQRYDALAARYRQGRIDQLGQELERHRRDREREREREAADECQTRVLREHPAGQFEVEPRHPELHRPFSMFTPTAGAYGLPARCVAPRSGGRRRGRAVQASVIGATRSRRHGPVLDRRRRR